MMELVLFLIHDIKLRYYFFHHILRNSFIMIKLMDYGIDFRFMMELY